MRKNTLTLLLTFVIGFGWVKISPAEDSIWTHKEQNFWVHIYKSPAYDQTPAADRAVLLLGAGSGVENVQESSRYVNPATGRPYDAVIGVGSPTAWEELNRVVTRDHMDAKENTGALGAAIAKHFEGKIEAATLDLHSNGNPLGITALEEGIGFKGIHKLNLIAPDQGMGSRYMDPDRLAAMVKKQGIRNVEFYVNREDWVPGLGTLSQAASDATSPLETLQNTAALILGKVMEPENARTTGLPLRYHIYDYGQPTQPVNAHVLATYLMLRALETGDAALIKKVRRSLNHEAAGLVLADAISKASARLKDLSGKMNECSSKFDDLNSRLNAALEEQRKAATGWTDAQAALNEKISRFESEKQRFETDKAGHAARNRKFILPGDQTALDAYNQESAVLDARGLELQEQNGRLTLEIGRLNRLEDAKSNWQEKITQLKKEQEEQARAKNGLGRQLKTNATLLAAWSLANLDD